MNMQSFAFILNPIAVNNKAFIPRFPYFCNRIGEAKISKFILYCLRFALPLAEKEIILMNKPQITIKDICPGVECLSFHRIESAQG